LALAKQLQQQLERKTTPLDSASALDMARLMVAVGEKAQAVAVLEGEVRNHPDDSALIDEVRGLFNAHGLANEGENISARIETLRRESVEMMNRGVLLARDGKFEEAVGWMRDARSRMPSNVRVVFNLVQILIMRMQALGTDPALLREARQALLETHKQAPGEKRFSELMAQLESLSATR
jgi:predicted Zn-dependent protease